MSPVVVGSTNVDDVLVALAIGLPSTVAAVAAVWSARVSRRNLMRTDTMQAEVESPNGRRTGQALYDLGLMMERIEERQKRTSKLVRELHAVQAEHVAKDELRFEEVFGHLKVKDPVDE